MKNNFALTLIGLLCIWSQTATADLSTVDGRLQAMVQENIDEPWPGISDPDNAPGVFSYALACLYLDTNVGEANDLIVDFYTNNPVPPKTSSARDDYNGYFWQHIMWRLYHDPAMNARLTSQARDIIEDNMWVWLETRSKLAEAGQDEWIIHDSENHDAMQKGSHLMCLVALKNSPRFGPDVVLADGGTVAEHLAAWTDFYLRYFPACGVAHKPVATGSRIILSSGRSYSFRELLWGYGWHGNSGTVRTYPMILAVSPYRVPDIITSMATDPARPNFLYSSRRFGRGGNWDGNRDYTVVFDNGDSSLRRDTWVTLDYSMGSYTSASTTNGYLLELGDLWAPVIIQTGQAGNYNDFTDFQTSVTANALTYASGIMNYTSEAGDRFTFYANSKTTPKVNGSTVDLNPVKTYDSPYLSMVHGEDIATISYTGYEDLELEHSCSDAALAG